LEAARLSAANAAEEEEEEDDDDDDNDEEVRRGGAGERLEAAVRDLRVVVETSFATLVRNQRALGRRLQRLETYLQVPTPEGSEVGRLAVVGTLVVPSTQSETGFSQSPSADESGLPAVVAEGMEGVEEGGVVGEEEEDDDDDLFLSS
jgi:hypothetical protein